MWYLNSKIVLLFHKKMFFDCFFFFFGTAILVLIEVLNWESMNTFDFEKKQDKIEEEIKDIKVVDRSVLIPGDMLSDYFLKQQNKIGKIFKNSKFQFFKIDPKMDKDNL